MIMCAAVSDEDGPANDSEARKRAEARRAEGRSNEGRNEGRGDATMGRIANLAGGWNVGGEGEGGGAAGAPAAAAAPAAPKEEPGLFDRPARPRASAPPPPRTPPRTAPPPPPRAARPTGAPLPGGEPARPPAVSSSGLTANALPPPGLPRPSAASVSASTSASAPSRAEDKRAEDRIDELFARLEATDDEPPPWKAEAKKPEPKIEPRPEPKIEARPEPKIERRPEPKFAIDLEEEPEATTIEAMPETRSSASSELLRPARPEPKPAVRDERTEALFDKPPTRRAAPLPRGLSEGEDIPMSFDSVDQPLDQPLDSALERALGSTSSGDDGDADDDGDDDFGDLAKPRAASRSAASNDSGLMFLPKPAPTPPTAAAPSSKAVAGKGASAAAEITGETTAELSGLAALEDDASGETVLPAPGLGLSASSRQGLGSSASGVPVGEFEPVTRKGSGEPAGESRGDATMIDTSHLRSDATELREARGAAVADAGIAATLRHAPSLPRRRGVWGDLRYVFTVAVGTRRARREMRKLEAEQLEREKTRRRHLMTIGRAAAGSAELDQTQIRKTRGNLQVVDQDRSNQAAQVAASDTEAEQVRRERASKSQAHREEIEKLELEIEQLTSKLEPMQRESAAARRRATDLRNALAKLDGRVGDVEAGRGKWADSASQAAELAALRAERQGVAREEPTIAAQLDALVPRIASIEASRERLRRKVVELNEEEEDDARRSDELLSAIAAKRKVVERATADAEKARERMLAELGERIYVDRPSYLSAQLSPVDSLDVELGDGQRRIMELKEILASVDRWKQVRGIVFWLLILGAIATGVVFWLQGQFPFLPPPPISL